MIDENYKYNISVMCPTRKRVNGCISSCDALLEHAAFPARVEILLMFDDDDLESYEKVKEHYKDKDNVKTFVSERHGYTHLHKYYNFLAEEAEGKWLFIWNDDATIGTKNWDLVPMSHGDEFRLIACAQDYPGTCLFPIFPKKWVELTGRVSNNCSNDTWVQDVSLASQTYVQDKRLHIHHLRETPEFQDDTNKERVYDTERFYSNEQKQEREDDIRKIIEYLESLKNG